MLTLHKFFWSTNYWCSDSLPCVNLFNQPLNTTIDDMYAVPRNYKIYSVYSIISKEISISAANGRCDGICRIIFLWSPHTGIRRRSLPLVWLPLRDDGGVC